MRILHVNTESGWRGGERQTFFTLKGLAERGVWCGLIAQKGGPLSEKAQRAGIEVFPLRMKGSADLVAAFKIAGICRKEKIDICHLQTSHAASLALLSKLFGNKSLLVASRRVDFPIKSGWKYNSFDSVVPISKAIERILLECGVNKELLRCIPSGVDTEYKLLSDLPELRKSLFGDAGFAIGAIGHLADHKGQKYLVGAMPAILKTIPEAKLVIIGGGELKDALQEQVNELGLRGKVIFTGFREDAPALINTFDLFIHPSRLEGLCTTILDVILRGVPVIASEVGGIPEALGEGKYGTLIPAENSEAISSAVAGFYSRGADQEKLKQGSEFVRRKFSIEAMVDQTLDLYRSLYTKTDQ